MKSHNRIYISRFSPSVGGHGGNRRTRQISELLEMLGVDTWQISMKNVAVRSFDRQSPLYTEDSFFDKLYNYNKFLDKIFAYDSEISDSICGCVRDFVVLDDPIFFPKTTRTLIKKSIPVVAVLHNIEAFLPRSLNENFRWKLFCEEIEILRKCRFVITISHEDTFVLKNFGIKCFYYPYYPSLDEVKFYENIKSKRSKTDKIYFVFLGTAYNSPTLLGMDYIYNIWPKISMKKYHIVFVGYGVSSYFVTNNDLKISVFGDVSRENLGEILSKCCASIIHQDHGSGALTKIPELLLAGIPVIANIHSARTYHNINGIISYQTDSELASILKTICFSKISISPPISPCPESFVQHFLSSF